VLELDPEIIGLISLFTLEAFRKKEE
jgi:hypothetical protein